MSWVAVARKDLRDTARSKVLWVTIALFVLFAGGLAYLWVEVLNRTQDLVQIAGQAAGIQHPETVGFITLMSSGILTIGPVLVFVPVIGLMLGYKSIVGERDSGQIKLLLSLPHTRQDVMVGKLAGRSAVAMISVLVGFFVAAVIVAALSTLAPLVFLQFVLAVALFALVHVSIGIGISSAAPSSAWAIGLVVAFVGIFQVMWGGAFFVLKLVLFDDVSATAPEWFRFLEGLSPGRAYGDALAVLVPEYAKLQSTIAQQQGGIPESEKPFFLQNEFGFLVLVAWAVVPLALGYLRFESIDLS